MSKPRQVCYLYLCRNIRCGRKERRGSNAKICSACGVGPLERLKRIHGPIRHGLKIAGLATAADAKGT
jgi:hypothetical protein